MGANAVKFIKNKKQPGKYFNVEKNILKNDSKKDFAKQNLNKDWNIVFV